MKTLALYPGTFNPFHIGHRNIAEKADRIFGKENVVIVLGTNPEKSTVGTDILERCEYLSKKIDRPVAFYTGFLHNFVEKLESEGKFDSIVIIRGLRNGEDLDYEINQIRFMDEFKTGNKLNFCFISCDKEYEHISSSAIRAIEKFGGEEATKKYL